MYTQGETANEQRTMEAVQRMASSFPDLSGLTLRDLFAMCYVVSGDTRPRCYDNMAQNAYEFADVMMNFRKNEK